MRSGAVVAAVALAIGGALVAPHRAVATAPVPTPSADSSPACTQLAEDHVSAVRPDGTELDETPGDGMGRRHYFRTTEGGFVQQVTPPPGFDPKTAPDRALETFGYPARPAASSAEGAQWDATWGARVPAAGQPQSVGYCEARGFGSAVANSAPAPLDNNAPSAAALGPCPIAANRAGAHASCYDTKYAGGGVTGATSSTYKDASTGWYQSNFRSTCSNDAYLTWAGLGGFNGKLMQAGTANSGVSHSLSPMFWEVLGPGYQAPVTYFFGVPYLPVINTTGGNNITAYVAYGTAGQAGQGVFTVRNVSTNLTVSTGYMSSVAGHPMSNFYDGSTAIYVTEVPNTLQLRQPYTGNTQFYFANANSAAINGLPSFNMTNSNHYSSATLQTSTFDGTSHVWQNNATGTCQ